MQNVVILGGGFAGVKAGLTLIKYAKKYDINITIIDKNNFHLFTPSLYQVVTSEEPSKNICIPFREIFGNSGIKIICQEVIKIDPAKNLVKLLDKENINFDYLIICLGSKVYYRDIPGLEKNSFPLKTLSDAVEIKKTIEKKYKEKSIRNSLEKLKIIIGGGGSLGTELAAEIVEYMKYLAKKFNHVDYFEILLIQGSYRLLKELKLKASEIAERRLHKEIKLCFKEHIKEVTLDTVKTDLDNEYKFDILIWTGGVSGNNIIKESGFSVNAKGQLLVNSYLQVNSFKNIFAAGDNTEFLNHTGHSYPGVVQVALSQGRTASGNIIKAIRSLPLKKYSFINPGYIVALKGRFAIVQTRYFLVWGFLGWLVQQFIVLRYLLGILSIPKAFSRWFRFEKELV